MDLQNYPGFVHVVPNHSQDVVKTLRAFAQTGVRLPVALPEKPAKKERVNCKPKQNPKTGLLPEAISHSRAFPIFLALPYSTLLDQYLLVKKVF